MESDCGSTKNLLTTMAHISMFCIIIACVLLPNLVEMKPYKKSEKLPLHIDADGSWNIKYGGLTVGKNEKGVVKVGSGLCVTTFDLSKPTTAELSSKKGSRQVDTVCKRPDLKKVGKKIQSLKKDIKEAKEAKTKKA
uniref:Transmembrane protein n=1 Tax=Trichobilharzia regenti TaxID=157069 RepID=A0AA85KK42_TRIRE|nr:unnamed protein product [Trichobilharzia regenti]